MQRLLLIDDDETLSAMLAEYLRREGFLVDTASDGESGVQRALGGQFELIVLDVMMPGTDGIEALRRIRAASQLPVLMLTARGDDIDRVIGLELGADDYVPKPCTPRELLARIRAILRRTESRTPDTLEIGPLKLAPAQRRAFWQGQALNLTGTEFELLSVLARHAGSLVDKQTLSNHALGRDSGRFDRSIDVHVSSIRHKLGARADGSSWILSVRGRGYQLAIDDDA